jgi:zinc transport system permease protein
LLGGMSHLVVARRLSFFSAALGQAALTGLTIGLVVLGEPLNGAYGGIFGFCFLSALAMVYVKRHAALPSDTLVGVFLSLTLGLGICLLVAVTKRFNIHQVEAVMFGSLLTVTDTDLAVLLITGIVIAVVFCVIYNQLLLDSLDVALARVGLAAAPADAVAEVRARVHYIARAAGGNGAVREFVEVLLRAQGKWEAFVSEWTSGAGR